MLRQEDYRPVNAEAETLSSGGDAAMATGRR
jgi:hypothetical protein